jgi:alpha-beta hydrolase superfamily lysophospholipase
MDKLKRYSKKLLKIALALFILLNIVCAFHAYKLTHFYSTEEAMPKPEQMGFGDKLSSIFFGVKFPKVASVDTFSLPHKTIILKTDDSLKLGGWYVDRDSAKYSATLAKGTVILFHGHGGKKNDVIREATSFYNLGYNVLLVDFRAHGNSEGNTCTVGFNESKDVKAAYDYVVQKSEKNIILYGISMGAATILKAIEDDVVHPQKIILEMPFGTLHQAVKGRLKIMQLPQEPFARLLTFWGGIEQGFWAFNFKPENYAKKVLCPTLLQWGANDRRVSQDETISILKNIGTNNKTFVEYKNSGHQSLCKNENDKWEQTIAAFLNNK